ncbi:MAG: sugar ABC transporter substrate-binding protein [Planctomycetota bacterium]|jgi:ribose transport system substrate-binding protein|nr:sugar ABC transporter substrate-binding protein [Planctomycetota bacterium]
MKKLFALAVVLSLGFALAADAADRVVKKKGGQPIKISWIGKTLNNPWWISCADSAIMEARNIGVDMKVALPQEEVDLEKQVTMVESAIEQGVDAIIISASSSDGIIPAIRKARDAGIKIINFDTRISDPKMYDAYVGADDVHGAYKAGMYMGEKLGGKGTVGLITGLLAQSTGVDRRKGFLEAMKNFPGIKVVENTAEWRSDLAANVTTNMLTANPDMKGIFACNDQMAVGMASAVKTEGLNPRDMVLIGYDGILDAVDLMLKGDLAADVALPFQEEGQIGVRMAVALVLNDGYVFDREMICDGPLVTVKNEKGTEMTIYEYVTKYYPLRGVTEKGY